MAVVVLAKVTPEADRLRVDPDRRVVDRTDPSPFLNPFDQRAVRVAIDHRSGGEPIVVVTLGPSTVTPVLEGTLALGADRAIVVTDDAFAGSDAPGTARALARAAEQLGATTVFTGARSTDGATGIVPSLVAGRLGIPLVSEVQRLERDGPMWVATADLPGGQARYRTRPPVVLAVGEKIAKLRAPTPEALANAAGRVERWDLARLELDPSAVGRTGAKSVVERFTDPAPARPGIRLDTGPIADRCERTVEFLRGRGPSRAVPSPPVRPREDPGRASDEVGVLVTDLAGQLDPRALGLVSGIRRWMSPGWPSALWIGTAPQRPDLDRLAAAGTMRLHWVARDGPVGDGWAAAAVHRVLDATPGIGTLLALDERFGRDVSGLIAATRNAAIVTGVVAVARGPTGGYLWRKPSLAGAVIAEVSTRGAPVVVTVQPGVWRIEDVPDPRALRAEPVEGPPAEDAIIMEDRIRNAPVPGADLTGAPVVVSIGLGLGGPERIAELEPTLRAWNAALAGSRKVVDAGWLPRDRQVGLTGRSLAPELVVLLGVSGSRHHLVGWRRAGTIIAVAADPAAPVFAAADVGLVGRWDEIVPELTAQLAPFARSLTAPG